LIASHDLRDSFALSRFLLRAITKREHMQTKDLQASEEKRAYYRLLRYLVGNDFEASYREDQAQSLQLTGHLKDLEHHELSKIH
jgi:hypothetical protein